MTPIGQLISETYSYRELLFALTYRDIRVKYKQAAMGVLWVFFMPVLAISSGVLFRVVLGVVSGHPPTAADIVSVMVKSVPWLLFAAIIGSASNSLLSNVGLITKIYFPRQVVPFSTVLSALFDFSISLVGLTFLLAMIWLFGDSSRPPVALTPWALMAPVFLLVLILLGVSVGVIFACANLFLRDVKYIVQVMLQFGIFFSLVYFKVSELGRWGWVMLINPVAPLLEGIRMALVDGRVDPYLWPWLAYSTSVAVIGVFVAAYVFEKAEYLFAEYA